MHAHGYGVFTGDADSHLSLYVVVVRTRAFDELHRRIHAALGTAGACFAGTTDPSVWTPHITLLDRGLTPSCWATRSRCSPADPTAHGRSPLNHLPSRADRGTWARSRCRWRSAPITALEHALFDRLAYRRLRDAFGGELRTAVSGGAPLGDRLALFFDGVGLRIFEGYDLTETAPTLTVNRPGAWKPGTVGQPVAGTTIRIAGDGEILARGPQVFQGYWNDEAATNEVFDDDGWFHTGDRGDLDDDGFLRITGRKKDLIVTASGKNIAGTPLEDRLRAHPMISQAIVLGDRRPFIAALIALDEEGATRWAQTHGRAGTSLEDLATDPRLLREIQRAVDTVNRSLSRAESIRKFVVLPQDLRVDTGELTPTLKVRRAVVERTYADEIQSLYGA